MASHLPLYDRRDNYVTVGRVAANFEQKVRGQEEWGIPWKVDNRPSNWEGGGHRREGRDLCQGTDNHEGIPEQAGGHGGDDRPGGMATHRWGQGEDRQSRRRSGDVGYVNEKGETFIVDRIKELIKVKGLQVPPAELEDLLHGHPGIADVAVVGIPDQRTGEKPKAFVVKSDPRLTEEEVKKYVEGRLSSGRELLFQARCPRTSGWPAEWSSSARYPNRRQGRSSGGCSATSRPRYK